MTRAATSIDRLRVVDTLSIRAARRLALARAGLLTPERTGLPRRARGRGPSAFASAHRVIRRFGDLQLDTVSVAGAPSHTILLLSRLAGRVVPEEPRRRPLSTAEGLETLLLAALDGHGWATTGTLAATWRLKNRKAELVATLRRLEEKGAVLACALEGREGSPTMGWIRPQHREQAAEVERARPSADAGVPLSPFDSLL